MVAVVDGGVIPAQPGHFQLKRCSGPALRGVMIAAGAGRHGGAAAELDAGAEAEVVGDTARCDNIAAPQCVQNI